MTQWYPVNGTESLALAACDRIGTMARQAIAQRGRFSLVLAGGSTPRHTYELLCSTEQDWSAWALYYGDERCLPKGHPQRNSSMVELTGLAGRAGGHYPIPAELGAETAAAIYAGTIEGVLPFDMVLLGMGGDGHTASLFPGQHWACRAVIPVHDAPKPPPDRVSLSPGSLRACREMLALIAGRSKREALREWRAGRHLPIAEVADVPQATVLLDHALEEGR